MRWLVLLAVIAALGYMLCNTWLLPFDPTVPMP
jgi:hypothetical protein